jgi:hypothetical protein
MPTNRFAVGLQADTSRVVVVLAHKLANPGMTKEEALELISAIIVLHDLKIADVVRAVAQWEE